MRMLSEDDLNLKELTREELDAAWDLWFDVAQSTNETDPPYTHGVFVSAGPSRDSNPPTAPADASPAPRTTGSKDT